ncbi:hypothetical protein DVA86_16975 [Streptomyces armeniacus]|uniref:Uncharacterized protein n=1 Tax=Streptomyces armeniacus TaxID=83291 RepID=A0A345XR32_9ACTN|nr:hypothetical protein [Streptomyces armeniacus]AXK34098.1 hypothetical protein DVA86_16975 [Streptomyces armeniacus]
MKRFARAAAVTGLTVGLSVIAAPAAFADIDITSVANTGDGDLYYAHQEDSPFAKQVAQNRPVVIDEFEAEAKTYIVKSFLKHSPIGYELEGAEVEQQD